MLKYNFILKTPPHIIQNNTTISLVQTNHMNQNHLNLINLTNQKLKWITKNIFPNNLNMFLLKRNMLLTFLKLKSKLSLHTNPINHLPKINQQFRKNPLKKRKTRKNQKK